MGETNKVNVGGDVKETAMNVGEKNITIINKIINNPETTSQDQPEPTAEAKYKPEKIEIPVVIMAMTQSEAVELKNENILNDDRKLSLFDCDCIKKYLKSLSDDKINDFTTHYGNNREEWIPYRYSSYYSFHQNHQNAEYKYSHFSMKRIICDMLEEYCNKYSQVSIEPIFISTDFFSDKEEEYRKARKYLDRSGGVLIIDGVSLLYPNIYRRLFGSGLISNPKISVLIFYPISCNTLERNLLIEQMLDVNKECVFARLTEDKYFPSEIGISDVRVFQRWLFFALHERSERRKLMNQVNQEKLKRRIRNDPVGIDKLWM